MQLLKLEIKRVLKTKTTWILLVLSLLLSAWLAYMPVTFSSYIYTDENGNNVKLTGLESLNFQNSLQSPITGEVTPEKVKEAITACQTCLKEYNVQSIDELPADVFTKKILPYYPLLHGVREILADAATGIAPSIMEIDPDEVDDYYSLCNKRIISLMKMEQKKHPAAQREGTRLYQQIEKPFIFNPASNSDVMDYQIILSYLVLLFCIIIAAPIFSSDYQTGSDDILRCTKYGQKRLGFAKVISALCISGISFFLCVTMYIIISNCLFGWECTQTSMQMMYSIVNLANMNMGQMQWVIALIGLLSVLATISLTLFLSSKFSNTVVSTAIALLIGILPIITSMMLPDKIGSWLCCIIPTGALCLNTSILYAITDFAFLNVGNIAIWTPYAIIAFAIIEIPVFIGLTIHSYSTHKTM